MHNVTLSTILLLNYDIRFLWLINISRSLTSFSFSMWGQFTNHFVKHQVYLMYSTALYHICSQVTLQHILRNTQIQVPNHNVEVLNYMYCIQILTYSKGMHYVLKRMKRYIFNWALKRSLYYYDFGSICFDFFLSPASLSIKFFSELTKQPMNKG